MKKLFITLSLILLGAVVQAQEISVMPIGVSKANAYGFESASDIIAKEIISLNRNFVPDGSAKNLSLKNIFSDKNKSINLKLFKGISVNDKNLIILSYVPDKNGKFFDVWDILKISTDFGISAPYSMEIKAVLIDSNENVVLWQKTYHQELNAFVAKDMTEAVDRKEKITSYARNIIAQDIVQNINLRLNPKKIDFASRVPKSSGVQEGIGLKYKNNAPIIKITPADDESFEERWRNDDSFNY